MKVLLKKFWIRLICGKRKQEGNYSVYWGKVDGENYIFEVGAFRSFIVDRLCSSGQWASHPLSRFFERMDELAKKPSIREKERNEQTLEELYDTLDEIDQNLNYASSAEGCAEKAETYTEISKLLLKIKTAESKEEQSTIN